MTDKTPASSSSCGGKADCCQPAVRRAYSELRRFGQPERYAFEAAVTVYRYYHPNVVQAHAETVVASWVWDGVRH
jgi:hypothetical protein